ncbi:MAG: protein kinase family protein [Calditrichaeota bacterium]|nr:MAG: protein kinase family protein [Calditrichota bacterium]
MSRKEQYFSLKEGQTLGRNYYIVEWLGRGYEGEVYKVEERHTGIIRAAKIFYPGKESRKQVLTYASKIHKLKSCPIVIQYHHRDISRVGGETVEFVVSDFADGEILSEYLERQPKKRLSSFEALHLFYELVCGVERFHVMGQYHGDIHSDNIMVKRRGLSFDIFLIDFFDLGRPSKEKVQEDIYDMITVLFEMIGGPKGYKTAGPDIKQIVMGRKRTLISRKAKNAGQMRLLLENLSWE